MVALGEEVLRLDAQRPCELVEGPHLRLPRVGRFGRFRGRAVLPPLRPPLRRPVAGQPLPGHPVSDKVRGPILPLGG